MKILAFSDMHQARSRAADIVAASAGADLVIGAGDFGNQRRGVAEAMEMLSGIKAPFVMVPGNNESLAELNAAAPSGAHVLHGTSVEIDGVTFFGIGGGIPPLPGCDWSWDFTEGEAEALLSGATTADVIISHSPPRGIADVVTGLGPVGYLALRETVERVQPKLVVCGHIHDCWGQEGLIGASQVRNLGPTVNWFEV
ncbi:metallophosphoesterase [Maritimibacter sp. DP1N21-5]|uniref:metallophosphoesterase family protein n=1 Tax=Maritimibacter sp. DP1N21-5 TaxID=2836867 RepID=UPI001C4658A5|nr:metallophosphoesterase [Maritimibacter sp. DP1N21-5]MBV7407629.1 metallophosphoesterase family protein [Maritimibacter sp. DP1N21-5]